jgi:hypothetical protein
MKTVAAYATGSKASSRQLGQQRLRLFQVVRIETLSESVADWGKESVGFLRQALIAPKARRAHRRA